MGRDGKAKRPRAGVVAGACCFGDMVNSSRIGVKGARSLAICKILRSGKAVDCAVTNTGQSMGVDQIATAFQFFMGNCFNAQPILVHLCPHMGVTQLAGTNPKMSAFAAQRKINILTFTSNDVRYGATQFNCKTPRSLGGRN